MTALLAGVTGAVRSQWFRHRRGSQLPSEREGGRRRQEPIGGGRDDAVAQHLVDRPKGHVRRPRDLIQRVDVGLEPGSHESPGDPQIPCPRSVGEMTPDLAFRRPLYVSQAGPLSSGYVRRA